MPVVIWDKEPLDQQDVWWHLCFNVTEKGQMIVPDWYNRFLEYSRKYGKNNVYKSDSILSSCGF